ELALRNRNATFNAVSGTENRYTLGSRLFGSLRETPLDYDVEAAVQLGSVRSESASAYMFSSELGAALGGPALRLKVGCEYASGDHTPGGTVHTFNQLFNDNHAWFGYVDAVGRQNVISPYAGVSGEPVEQATFWFTGHYFARASTSDAFYGPGGVVVRA